MVIIAALTSTGFAQAPDTKATNHAAIEDVVSGRSDTANAAWWAFDAEDATTAIQAAINSKARKVIIPFTGRDWIIRPVTLASNQEITFEPGVVVLAKSGEFRGTHDALFMGREIQNVRLVGYGATARMRKADYAATTYERSEWRHVIALHGASNVEISGLTLESSGGDGIYLGPTYDDRRVPCRNITITDCRCNDHFRQGISVVSGESIRIQNCEFKDTKGTLPAAGVDVEPSHPRDLAVDIHITDCRAIGTAGSGFLVSLTRQNHESRPASVRVANCVVENSHGPGLRTVLRDEGTPSGLVEFVNCTVENSFYAGAMVQWAASAEVKLRFKQCRWRNVAKRTADVPIYIELFGRLGGGQIEFDSCYVHDEKRRRPLRVVTDNDVTLSSAITGQLHLINPQFAADGGLGNEKFPGLEVLHDK